MELATNRTVLTVTDNGVFVKVGCNVGIVDVSGERVCLLVERNRGTVNVEGANARVLVFDNCGVVNVTGPRGCVRVLDNSGIVENCGASGCVRVGGGGVAESSGAGGHVERHLPKDAPPCSCAPHATPLHSAPPAPRTPVSSSREIFRSDRTHIFIRSGNSYNININSFSSYNGNNR